MSHQRRKLTGGGQEFRTLVRIRDESGFAFRAGDEIGQEIGEGLFAEELFQGCDAQELLLIRVFSGLFDSCRNGCIIREAAVCAAGDHLETGIGMAPERISLTPAASFFFS